MTLVLARRSVASAMIAVLILSALALAGAAPISLVRAAETADVIVQLEGTPAAITRSQGGDSSAQVQRLRASQDAFLARLSDAGVTATVLTTPYQEGGGPATSVPLRYYWTLNGLALRVPAGTANAIRSIEGVTNVTPVRQVQAFLDTSVPHTNAPSVWEDYGFFGEGITVADIDTGIAWDHGMFTTDPAAVPGVNHEKITKYYTFTEGLYDGNGHGTHVGGIIAGDNDLGYTPNPVTGYGEALLDGVAPKATLFGYKVLSDAGTGLNASVVLAVDTAVADNADVLNLSLGSDVDAPDSPESVALANAMAAGHFVAVAAGNAGPGYSTIGTPATREEILTVGSSTDPGNIQYYIDDRDGGDRFAINLMSNSPAPSSDPLVDERYVYVGEGCTPADYGLVEPVLGKVALIKRGTCTFSVKKDLAETNGAIAALIFNNVEGNFSGSMSASRIVVGALSDVDGAHLVAQTDARGLSTDTLLFDPNGDTRVGQISGFSSRGPTDDYRIKPDIVAPGDSITSSVTPIPNPLGVGEPSGYSDAGGTSMASPHMAGAAALMVEAHPDWTTREIKAAFMNTAVQLSDPVDGRPYSILDQGAGMVDVRAAMDTPALIVNPSHSFGEARTGGGTATFTAEFTIIDKSGDGGTWSLAWQDGDGRGRGGEGRTLPASGWSQALSPASVSVPAGGSATFTLSVTMDGAALLEGDYEGRIVATGDGTTLRVPVFAHHDITPPSAQQREAPVLDDPGETSTTGTYDLAWSDVADESAYAVQQATDFETVFSDDAESGMAGRWTTEGVPTGWMGSQVRSDSPDTSYTSLNTDEKTSTLTLANPISVPEGSDATISFSSFEDTEPAFDYGYVEASNDGGATWETLLTINGWSGGDWIPRSATAAGLSGDVIFRFRYVTDQLISAPLYEGWYVDDIAIGVGQWSSIGETGADETAFTVTDQSNGTFYHRVAGLFDTGSSELAPGPWSNVVDIIVERSLPNLSISDMSAADGPDSRTVTLTATVSNAGEADAAASATEFTLEDGSVIGVADTPAIPSGGNAVVSVRWDVRGVRGTHVVTASADSAATVDESDEGDNDGRLTVEVRGNRVRNQSFEESNAAGTAPEGWTASSTDAGTADWSEGGSDGERSVTFTGTGGSAALAGSPTWTSDPIDVSAGETLNVSAYVSSAGASSAGRLAVAYLGPAGELLDTVTVLTAPLSTDGFELVESTVTVPAGVTQVSLVLAGFAATDLATSGSVTYDDLWVYAE